MKITFLGTGAADWPLNKPERMSEFRRMSSVLIDDILLIDPGPQVIDALEVHGKELRKIRYIINTHRHGDHFSAESVARLEASGAVFIPVAEGEQRKLDQYTVRAYKGNHGTCESTVHYMITDNKRTLFYGLDGAWLLYDEVQAIKKYKPDYGVFDATIGNVPGDYRIFEHNDLNMVIEMKKALDAYIGKFCISHMARTLHTNHKELTRAMKKHNIIVAYDGFETEI